MKKILTPVIATLLVGGSLWCWYAGNTHVVWSLCCLGGLWLYGSLRVRKTSWRALWINLLFITLFLAGLEWFIAARKPREETTTWSNKPLFAMDASRGYHAAPGAMRRAQKKNADGVVYDIVYRYDADGLRLTPPPAKSKNGSILLFGCSYTLGEGVQENECFAYVAGQRSGLKAYNFGFHGYGTHNLLAALDSGAVGQAVKNPPAGVVYLALTCHIWRAAGLPQWNWNDFEYQLDPSGKPQNLGVFSRPSERFSTRWWKNGLFSFCYRSATFRHIYERFYPKFIRENDLRRFVSLTAAMRDRVKTLYPDAPFTVILWTEHERENRRILPLLRQQGIKVVTIDEILPGFRQEENKYRIPGDGHPNAMAHRLLGTYIAEKLVLTPQ